MLETAVVLVAELTIELTVVEVVFDELFIVDEMLDELTTVEEALDELTTVDEVLDTATEAEVELGELPAVVVQGTTAVSWVQAVLSVTVPDGVAVPMVE